MSVRLFSCCIAAALLVCATPTHAARQYTQSAFSPSVETVELIIRNITQAHETIHVAAYSFTSEAIADALLEAHQRGVKVQVVVDKSQAKDKRSVVRKLAAGGITVRINRRYAIMHNKFMVFDDQNVQAGSFNYTKSAEKRNAENVIVIRNNPHLAKKYLSHWQKLWDEATEYQPSTEK